jgi:hypothetical protein
MTDNTMSKIKRTKIQAMMQDSITVAFARKWGIKRQNK